MANEGALPFSMTSVVENVLQQHGVRSRDLDLDSRRAEEAAIRRYEAAAWLRKMVGVVGARDLPAEPSEEEFRLVLRSGLILCNVLNKIQPGAVPKVVESPCDSTQIPDGAALSAYQFFENGGKSARIVDCVLGLKSYSEWKQAGGNGVWKFGGNVKLTTPMRHHMRKNSDPFTNSLSRNVSMNEKTSSNFCPESEYSKVPNSPLSKLVRAILLDKKAEEVPTLLESVLTKVMEEFEHRIASQVELKNVSSKDIVFSHGNKVLQRRNSGDTKIQDSNVAPPKKEQYSPKNCVSDEELKRRSMKQLMVFDGQQRNINELKQTLSATKAGMQFMQLKFYEEMQNLGLHIHGLAHAASGYHKVLTENRKLYNQVQDLKDPFWEVNQTIRVLWIRLNKEQLPLALHPDMEKGISPSTSTRYMDPPQLKGRYFLIPGN